MGALGKNKTRRVRITKRPCLLAVKNNIRMVLDNLEDHFHNYNQESMQSVCFQICGLMSNGLVWMMKRLVKKEDGLWEQGRFLKSCFRETLW